MDDVGALMLRMVVSLTVVLGFVAGAYAVARRRQRGGGMAAMMRRRQRAASAPTLDIEARAGLARGSAAVAVRFADRIVLVGVTDGAPATVLAEVPAEQWDRVPDAADAEGDDTQIASPVRTPFDPNGVVGERPSFIEALRDATSRRP
ncbi:MAG: flagellar biosynthetic protein FliO [Actinomycetota bacterium]